MHAVCVGAHGDQKRVLDPLELEFQVVVSCLMWVLGTKPRSSARAANTLTAEPSLQPLSIY